MLIDLDIDYNGFLSRVDTGRYLLLELEPGHAHLCPRAHEGYGHCRCICDFDAREALRKLVES